MANRISPSMLYHLTPGKTWLFPTRSVQELLTAGLHKQSHGPISPQFVTAGAHTVRYDYESEIRFGPPLYRATVAGPRGNRISKQLGRYLLCAPNSPYQAQLEWYAFIEWRGDLNGKGSSAVRIFDLLSGKSIAIQVVGSAGFIGWRGGRSSEYLLQVYTKHRSSGWFACDARAGKMRLLFQGGYECRISANGGFLIVLHTREEVFVALMAIESASVLDLKKAADFQIVAEKVTGLDTLHFDPQIPGLVSMLNWTKTDYQTSQVTFEKLIAIEIGNSDTE